MGSTGAKLINADFTGADLTEATLDGVNLYHADLTRGNLDRANLSDSDLTGVNLTRADLIKATFTGVNLTGANLNGTNFYGANLTGADLSRANLDDASFYEANLTEANLTKAHLIETNFEKANLSGCRIYGISAWDLKLQDTLQLDLIITPDGDPDITVDNLEVAQFIYLLRNNEKLKNVIDTITSKVVLILGRFTPERKVVLDALKKELRNYTYLPILFDFEKPNSRNLTETITLLARMARFIIADITDAKSIPQELYAIVPHLPSVPVKPLLISSQKEYAMSESFKGYPWFLETYYYESVEEILGSIKEKIINPAEEKARELSPTISHR